MLKKYPIIINSVLLAEKTQLADAKNKDKLMRCQTVIVDKSCVLKIKSAFFCFFGVIEILRETAKLKRRKNEKKQKLHAQC